MSSKATIQHTLGTSDMLMEKYLTDLASDAYFVRPVHGMNHIAWQLGHLISSERRMIESIKPGSSPALPEGFDAMHAMDKHASDQPADFCTHEEYRKLWKEQRGVTQSVLAGMSDAELDAPCPNEKLVKMAPTVGSVFNLTGLHTMMHVCQFVAVRRQQEMPIAF